jgi:hypothetical protein
MNGSAAEEELARARLKLNAKKNEKLTSRDEKNSRTSKYSVSDDERDSDYKYKTSRKKDDENDLRRRNKASPSESPKHKQRNESRSRESNSLSYSPMEKYPHRYADVLSDVPKKAQKQQLKSSSLDRESERIKEMANKARSVVAGRTRKEVETRADEEVSPPLPASSTVTPPLPPSPSPNKTSEKERMVAKEDSEAGMSAADMVDEAVKKTATALAANREKTLESLKKLLSMSFKTGKESDSSSGSHSSRKERRSASSSSSSASSSDSSRR